MKKLLTIIAIVLPLLYLSSCNDTTVNPPVDKPLLEFVSVVDSVTAISGLMESGAKIKNVSDKQITIKVKLEIVSLVPGHKALVCIGGSCFMGTTVDKLYPTTIVLEPGEVSTKTDFFAELDPLGVPGISKVRYKFIPESDSTKTISYICAYHVVTSM